MNKPWITKLGRNYQKYFIRIVPGCEIMDAIKKFAELPENKGKFITFSGIGGGYTKVKLTFSQSEKLHGESSLMITVPKNEMLELTSFQGNITQIDGKTFVHAHGVFSDKNSNKIYSGHVVEAQLVEKNGLTGEIVAEVYDVEINRIVDEESGLPLKFTSKGYEKKQ